MITKDEFALWKMHPVTQAFFAATQHQLFEGIAELNSGMHSADIGKTYLIIGKLNAYQSILEGNIELTEEKDD